MAQVLRMTEHLDRVEPIEKTAIDRSLADIAGRLATTLRNEVEQQGLLKVYDEIDLPLVPVLSRMEQAGVKAGLK